MDGKKCHRKTPKNHSKPVKFLTVRTEICNLIRKYPPKKIEIFKLHNLAKRKYEILEKKFYTENIIDAQINDFKNQLKETFDNVEIIEI